MSAVDDWPGWGVLEGDWHDYLSTACHHGRHDYCNSMTGYQGEKRPARCKFCDAMCRCMCHNSQRPARRAVRDNPQA